MTCYTPHYSPDGKFISCIAEGDKIAVLSAENSSVIKNFEPVQFPYFNIRAKWSPDGQSLIYIARRKDFSNLWRQPINGGEPQPLTDFTSGELHNFTFSTDSSRLYIARGFQVRDVILIKNFK
jgi:WD40 repeat protein